MTKYILLTALLIPSFFSSLQAQVYEKRTVHAGENLSEVSYYLFPSFTAATVKFKNGGELQSTMNFNMLICQMQFIDPHGDTLNVAKLADIDTIAFDSVSFFYDKGYYEIVTAANGIKLAVLRKASYEPVKIGALDIRNHSGAGVEDYSSFLFKSTQRKLTLNEDIDITRETTFFLIAKDGERVKANKAGFLKLFPGNAGSVKNYIKQNKPDFNREDDLKKLLEFCVTPG